MANADSTLVDLDEVTNEVVEARWVFDKPEGHVTPEWKSAMRSLWNLLYKKDLDYLTEGEEFHPFPALSRMRKGIESPPTGSMRFNQKFADSFFEKDSPVWKKTRHDYSLLANAVLKEATPSFLMRIAKDVLLDDKYAEKGLAVFKSDPARSRKSLENPWLRGFKNLYNLVYHGESGWISPAAKWDIGEAHWFTPDPFDSVIPPRRLSKDEHHDWMLKHEPAESVEWIRKTGLDYAYGMPYASGLLEVTDEHELHGVRAAILRGLEPIIADSQAAFNILHLVMAYKRVFRMNMPVEMWQNITRLSNTYRPTRYSEEGFGAKTAWKEYPTLKKPPQLALKSKLVYV